MDFNPSRTAVRVIVSLRPPVSFLPIGTREERGEREKGRGTVEWRNPGGEGRWMRKETQSFAIPRRTAFKLYEGIY